MVFNETKLSGAFVIELERRGDELFFEPHGANGSGKRGATRFSRHGRETRVARRVVEGRDVFQFGHFL